MGCTKSKLRPVGEFPHKAQKAWPNMKRLKGFRVVPLLACVTLITAASCAVDGGAGGHGVLAPPPHAAAWAGRLGLAPTLRPFYDELEQYGDWVLVEPQGWVFRPRVNTVAWRPYQDGHWEPSYSFGWVWESNEPFGWITDHYGFWFNDEFQGWVWKPYGAWAPSWVAWVQVGDYVGWAPLAPDGTTSYDKVPGGVFTYVPATALAQPSAGIHASYVNAVPDDGSDMRPIDRVVSYHGVHWNAGPDLAEVLGIAAADRLRLEERDGTLPVPAAPRGLSGEPRVFELPALEARTHRVWNEARREFTAARRGSAGSTPNANSPTPRPAPRIRPEVKPRPAHEPEAPDTLGTAPGDSLRMRKAHRPGKPSPPPPGSGND